MNKLYKISALLSCAVLSLFFSMDVYAQETDPIVKRTPVWEHYWWRCEDPFRPVIFKNFRFSLEEEHASGAKENKPILTFVNGEWVAGEGLLFIAAPNRNYMGHQTFTSAGLIGHQENDITINNFTDFGDKWAECTKRELTGSCTTSGNDVGWLWELPASDMTVTMWEYDYSSFETATTTQSDYQPLFEVAKEHPDKNIVYFANAFYRCDFFIRPVRYIYAEMSLYLSVPKAAIWYDNNLYYQPDDDMRPTISYEMTDIPHGKEYIIAKKLKASISMEYLGLPMFSRTDYDLYITPPTDPELIKLARENGWMN
ncbi:MAG: hypothetical protein K2F76_04785 [Duncaniella dubosii]|nr:hypothetical protein [Duncaniella dubosii]